MRPVAKSRPYPVGSGASASANEGANPIYRARCLSGAAGGAGGASACFIEVALTSGTGGGGGGGGASVASS